MGQRLNLEIVSNSRTLANAYYHWSAYTGSSIYLTRQALEAYKIYEECNDPVELAICMLEHTGAGVSDEEKTRIVFDPELSKYEIWSCTSRNDGLLSITPEGIAETEYWEEGRVTINIEEETVNFYVYYEYPFDEWREEHEGWYKDETEMKKEYEKYPVIDFDIRDMDFYEFLKFEEVYEKSADTFGYRKPDGSVVCWVE